MALDAVAPDAAGWPDDEALAACQAGGDGGDGLFRLGAGAHTGDIEVGHLQGVDQPDEEAPGQPLEGAAVDERPHPQGRPQHGEKQEGIDVTGVIGQNEHRPLESAKPLPSVDEQAVARGERQPQEGPTEPAQYRHDAVSLSESTYFEDVWTAAPFA